MKSIVRTLILSGVLSYAVIGNSHAATVTDKASAATVSCTADAFYSGKYTTGEICGVAGSALLGMNWSTVEIDATQPVAASQQAKRYTKCTSASTESACKAYSKVLKGLPVGAYAVVKNNGTPASKAEYRQMLPELKAIRAKVDELQNADKGPNLECTPAIYAKAWGGINDGRNYRGCRVAGDHLAGLNWKRVVVSENVVPSGKNWSPDWVKCHAAFSSYAACKPLRAKVEALAGSGWLVVPKKRVNIDDYPGSESLDAMPLPMSTNPPKNLKTIIGG